MNKKLKIIFALLLVSFSGFIYTEESSSPCAHARAHDFDFWLGEWQVTTANGEHAGDNSIVAEQKECVLVERWIGMSGSTGSSFNYYDLSQNNWRQLWISPGVQIDMSGGLQDDSMILEGHIFYSKNGRRHGFRGSWTPLEDGRIHQFFEQLDDQGNWQPWFEGFYLRSESKLK